MGLRSRQRRLAGITRESSLEAFDEQVKTTLQEHLAHSQNDVAAFNLLWKGFLGKLGYALVGFEILSVWYAISTTSILGLALIAATKIASCTAILLTKTYVTEGDQYAPAQTLSVGLALLWGVSGLFGADDALRRSTVPLSAIYFSGVAASVWFMGSNTKAEVARAKQLAKLETVFRQ
ncbi:hypothetical protein SDRG_15110 [Saprolegnia diclina VS20]|uniref:Uncharacterized protein n=1 Tax=Saprolegnia diclina (strain VS20) TaxID=1156394 RepID=T0RC00_SAPDV|nr:hypothetical protein SDRG_15110 [Saprolegnia diclina VS20]EQC27102.1 hypothetical protein SDRG_15110 [Saprolegnia diclina VS20]|eukprot:XP_008619496.1 hypothetical protein SDRG_15110 [Saprolegnia diclina VS20]